MAKIEMIPQVVERCPLKKPSIPDLTKYKKESEEEA